MAVFDMEYPTFQTVEGAQGYCKRLVEKLQFVLSNLDEDNILRQNEQRADEEIQSGTVQCTFRCNTFTADTGMVFPIYTTRYFYVDLPKPFSNVDYQVFITLKSNAIGAEPIAAVDPISRSRFRVTVRNTATGNSNQPLTFNDGYSFPLTIQWLAVKN